MPFEHIFSPIKINQLSLQSRVIMGSMHVGLEGQTNGLEKLIAFYKERARTPIGLIVTGGAAISKEGSGGTHFMSIYDDKDILTWKKLTDAVHAVNGKIALQLFHAGRYAYKALTGFEPVAPSPIRSPINPDTPLELTEENILHIIQSFALAAKRAKQANFDAIEVMGSEGYLINQFTSPHTNKRTDRWGGTFNNRMRFSLEIVKAIRRQVGSTFPIIFRMSGLDLVENSTTEAETLLWAEALERAGVDALNIGIGWHESKIPTISMKVPRNSFVYVAKNIKKHVAIPVIASNRINNPIDIDTILKNEDADLVSMARPFLADPHILTKAHENRIEEINTCIACNQACLDHVFDLKPASCLVNPQACRELNLEIKQARLKKTVVVIGAGPAGLETARVLALRGHHVQLYEKDEQIGGQLNYAKLVPGKAEFHETIRYYQVQLANLGVEVKLNYKLTANDPLLQQADEIVISTGGLPRKPTIPGITDTNTLSYLDVFQGNACTTGHVLIIGGGGIACDLAQFLKEKGVAKITMLQRGNQFARGIGKTTRWATLLDLKKSGVTMIGGIKKYLSMTNDSIEFLLHEEVHRMHADTIVYASGQYENDALYNLIKNNSAPVHIIGGANNSNGIDAKQAIYEGTIVGRNI